MRWLATPPIARASIVRAPLAASRDQPVVAAGRARRSRCRSRAAACARSTSTTAATTASGSISRITRPRDVPARVDAQRRRRARPAAARARRRAAAAARRRRLLAPARREHRRARAGSSSCSSSLLWRSRSSCCRAACSSPAHRRSHARTRPRPACRRRVLRSSRRSRRSRSSARPVSGRWLHRAATRADRRALVLGGLLGLAAWSCAHRPWIGPARYLALGRSRSHNRHALLVLGAAELAWIWLVPALALVLAPRTRFAAPLAIASHSCRSCWCCIRSSFARPRGTAFSGLTSRSRCGLGFLRFPLAATAWWLRPPHPRPLGTLVLGRGVRTRRRAGFVAASLAIPVQPREFEHFQLGCKRACPSYCITVPLQRNLPGELMPESQSSFRFAACDVGVAEQPGSDRTAAPG